MISVEAAAPFQMRLGDIFRAMAEYFYPCASEHEQLILVYSLVLE